MVAADQVWEFEGLRLDMSAHTLFGRRGEEITLRRSEYELLLALVMHPGRALSRDFLLDAVAGRRSEPYDRSIDVLVGRLRRKIELDLKQPRLILTVPGVGYRFATKPHSGSLPADPEIKAAAIATPRHPRATPAPVTMPDLSIAKAPRLSLVVLPFANLGGDKQDDYLADAITEDLTTDLSYLPGCLVIARHSAATYKDKPVDVRRIGEELGIRYVVEGSVRRLGDMLRVNVQLISAENNTHVWAGRFDQNIRDLGIGQEEIVSRMRAVLRVQVFDAEIRRSLRERPDNPDAADLILRGSSWWRNVRSSQWDTYAALFERALHLDPQSVRAMCSLAGVLIDAFVVPELPSRGNEELLARATTLAATAEAIEPESERVMVLQGSLLRAQGHLPEAIATFQSVIELFPNNLTAYRQLGFLRLSIGDTEDAISLLQRSIRLDPLSPWNRHSYSRIGISLLLLGRDEASIEWQQRALTIGAMAPASWRAQCYLFMASAMGSLGRLDEAHCALGDASRLWPFATVRSLPPSMTPRGLPHPAYLAQMRHVQEGLRLAGLRDHADENADFGVAPAGDVLHADLVAPTPDSAPGAKTIRTSELTSLLSRTKPLLIDVAQDSCGRSLPSAVGLQGTGHGACFSQKIQARFVRKIHDLTAGDLTKPIVTFCVNSERFTGYNLALRLVALGCTDVHWYRGGVEAWQVNGLPDSDLDVHQW
jgi:adenylate cyclase